MNSLQDFQDTFTSSTVAPYSFSPPPSSPSSLATLFIQTDHTTEKIMKSLEEEDEDTSDDNSDDNEPEGDGLRAKDPVNGVRSNGRNGFRAKNEKIQQSITIVSGESCDSIQCQFGGQCLYNERGLAYCHCKFDCRTRMDSTQNRKFIFVSTFFENICGSDGNVYENECDLKMKSCLLQKQIHIEEKSFCESRKNLDRNEKNEIEAASINEKEY
ncbi:Tomoregulin-1-like protein [Dinothrombium tinctorium]|uniref:Tomoregulin-1-like protein n=1 Tax=Dinothrombium tinctorium TaxID=1965070 RepID=A0A3S3PI32_9ACAR|nr:Tomoregulin-1-like protein [Dinothrombium tinctorium]